MSDLRKIKKFVENYNLSATQTEAENLQIKEENRQRKLRNERMTANDKQKSDAWEQSSGWSRSIQRMNQIHDQLWEMRVGMLGGLFQLKIRFEHFDVPKDQGFPLIEEYKKLERKLANICQTRPDLSATQIPMLKEKRPPLPYTSMVISGAKVKVGASSVDIQIIDERIAALEDVALREKEKQRQLRARIIEKETETRNQAKRYRYPRAISEQLNIVGCCPYCAGGLDPTSAHQDHIHPVCKGGHSVKRNLVYVCSSCNMKKREETLGKFLRINGFSVDIVHARLEKLKKDY